MYYKLYLSVIKVLLLEKISIEFSKNVRFSVSIIYFDLISAEVSPLVVILLFFLKYLI